MLHAVITAPQEYIRLLGYGFYPLFMLIFGIFVGCIGSEGTWAIVWLVRNAIVHRHTRANDEKYQVVLKHKENDTTKAKGERA